MYCTGRVQCMKMERDEVVLEMSFKQHPQGTGCRREGEKQRRKRREVNTEDESKLTIKMSEKVIRNHTINYSLLKIHNTHDLV